MIMTNLKTQNLDQISVIKSKTNFSSEFLRKPQPQNLYQLVITAKSLYSGKGKAMIGPWSQNLENYYKTNQGKDLTQINISNHWIGGHDVRRYFWIIKFEMSALYLNKAEIEMQMWIWNSTRLHHDDNCHRQRDFSWTEHQQGGHRARRSPDGNISYCIVSFYQLHT